MPSPRLGSGFVAILTVELHFPEAASLKGKRHHVRSAKDNLRTAIQKKQNVTPEKQYV